MYVCFLWRTYSVICLEVVNVLAKDERPQVLAEKLDYVEGVVEAGSVARESVAPSMIRDLFSYCFFWILDTDMWKMSRTFPQDPAQRDIPATRACNAPHRDAPRRLSSWAYPPLLLRRPRPCRTRPSPRCGEEIAGRLLWKRLLFRRGARRSRGRW